MQDKPSHIDAGEDAAAALQRQIRQQKQGAVEAAMTAAQAARQRRPPPAWWLRMRRYLPGILFSLVLVVIFAVADHLKTQWAEDKAPPPLPSHLSPYRATLAAPPQDSVAVDTLQKPQP